MMVGWEGLFALFYSMLEMEMMKMDEDGGGRGGGGGNGISEPTSALPTGHQAEYVIMRRLPMYDVVRENRYPSSGIQ